MGRGGLLKGMFPRVSPWAIFIVSLPGDLGYTVEGIPGLKIDTWGNRCKGAEAFFTAYDGKARG
jgi:hypothetical protein